MALTHHSTLDIVPQSFGRETIMTYVRCLAVAAAVIFMASIQAGVAAPSAPEVYQSCKERGDC